ALATPAVAAWTTVFVAICVQASPYLALGVGVSTAIAVFVPAAFFQRALPRRPEFAVPLAGLAGAALPGCECGSVPVAASLMRRGVARGPAVAFLLSAPAINPVVLVATAVAFPGHPIMVAARAAASLLTSVLVGWLWQRLGRDSPLPNRFIELPDASPWERARAIAAHDVTQAIGFLTVGAAAAATLNVSVPRSFLAHFAQHEAIAIPALALLAVILAVCSEADAFVAASLTQFSLTARLTFMVVGPAVDVKLIAMQLGTFGRQFTQRFAPLTAVTACLSAALIGGILL
ncbi:MAG: permease, partial [Frankiales bacterium]|nr:permease [Frankiales bacterium]